MRLSFPGRRPLLLLLALCAAVALGLHWAWSAVTRPQGSQRVSFIPAEVQCASDGPLSYCVYRARGGTNGDIVYHMHGRNLDERVWNDDTYFTGLIQAAWQQREVVPPLVVSLSYGPSWLLVSKGGADESGLLEDVIGRLPAIEEQVGAPRRRILLGESMGGLNVLVAGLSYPDRFSKIASLCPGVYKVSPFAPFAEIRAAMERTGANPEIIFGIWQMARDYYADEKEWQAGSPLTLIEKAGAEAPELYLANGLHDAYGNFEGTQALAQRAAALDVKTEWRPMYGGHCVSDVVSLAGFLAS